MSITLLLHPRFGLGLPEYKQWWSFLFLLYSFLSFLYTRTAVLRAKEAVVSHCPSYVGCPLPTLGEFKKQWAIGG